jgi:WD40 repeat protein
VCHGAPKKDCQGCHTVIDLTKDAELLESLLEGKSTDVDNCLSEAVAKREQTYEHLLVLIETFKSMAEQNASCIQKLRTKIQKGVETQYFLASQQAVGFGSIMKDLEKAVQEASKEVEEADCALHQVVSTTRIAIETKQKSAQILDGESLLKLHSAVATCIPSIHLSPSGSRGTLKAHINRNGGFSADRLNANQTVHCKDLTGHSSLIRAIEFSDDESLLVSGGRDDHVLIWNMSKVNVTPTVLKVSADQDSDLFALAISPDNGRIIVGGSDPDIVVFDTKTYI